MVGDRRRRVVSREEAKLWRDAMRGVMPFPDRLPIEEEDEATAEPVGVEPAAKPVAAIPVALRPAPPPGAAAPRGLAHGESPGVDRRTAERLKRGEMAIEASIDLHGLTQELAHAALWRFVTGSAERGRRCLLVITGKGNRDGTGVLRAQVPRWLNEAALRPLVLAFAYAQPKHGGEGALYVLLRRRR